MSDDDDDDDDDDDENDSKVDGVNGRFANESLLHDAIIGKHMIKWKFVDDQQLPGNVNGKRKVTHLTNSSSSSSSSSICASEIMMIICLVHGKIMMIMMTIMAMAMAADGDGDGDGDGDKYYYNIFL
uniref:Uncharacterized protein n=2 Tax=Glossina palpalis gambiensis TaxID=67801 RepID=A0A1B0B328_9MUSC